MEAVFEGERWQAYEIHMGRSLRPSGNTPLLHVSDSGNLRPEGARINGVWGTYLHGLFESAAIRRKIGNLAEFGTHNIAPVPFRTQRAALYNGMADLLEAHLNLEDLWRYVEN